MALAGEVLDGAHDGFAVGLGDIHQHAVHVENDQVLHHISSSAASSAARLLARADGDAHAAGHFVAAVAHQDAAFAQASRISIARRPARIRTKFAELGT